MLYLVVFLFSAGLIYLINQPNSMDRLKRFITSANESDTEVIVASEAPIKQLGTAAVMAFSPDGKTIAAVAGREPRICHFEHFEYWVQVDRSKA